MGADKQGMTSTVSSVVSEEAATLFLVRQPVFDRRMRVHAYELVARLEGARDDDASTAAVARVMAHSNLDAITGGKPALLELTRQLLLSEQATLLPPERLVLQIDADLLTESDVAAGCRRLLRRGYRLCLRGVGAAHDPADLVQAASILRVDWAATDATFRQRLAGGLGTSDVALLAERIDDASQLDEAMRLGYAYLHGGFFSRPAVVGVRDIELSQTSYHSLLQAVHRPTLDLDEVEAAFRGDVALADKLLRYINSAAFSWRHHISSFRHALVLLGDNQVRKWVTLVVLADLARDKPAELTTRSLLRAHMCETIGRLAGLGYETLELFLVGMYSMIDAILDQSLEVAIESLPLSDSVRSALLGRPGALRVLLDCVIAYEQGEWDEASTMITDSLALPATALPGAYRKALEFVGTLP